MGQAASGFCENRSLVPVGVVASKCFEYQLSRECKHAGSNGELFGWTLLTADLGHFVVYCFNRGK